MSLFPSVLDLLDAPARPVVCPGCGAHSPAWVRVTVDGLRVLTHDGDLICPNDRHFGACTRRSPSTVPARVSVLGVTA